MGKTAKLVLCAFLWIVLIFVACDQEGCDDNSPVGPTTGVPPVEPEPMPGPDPLPDRNDSMPPPMGGRIVGFTAFSLVETYDAGIGYEDASALGRQYIYRMLTYMRSRGFNTARVGAQTDGWCDSDAFYLPCGTTPGTPEWAENLKGFLEISARVDGMYVQLIPTFTHKGDRCGKPCLVSLTKSVVDIVKAESYQHVFWEAFNEFNHPITRGAGNLREAVLRAVLKELPHPRGTDLPDNGGEGDDWRGNPDQSAVDGAVALMDYVAYHPSRNPEPTAKAYRRTINLSPRPVLFDETVSWITMGEQIALGGRKNSALFTQGTQAQMDAQVQAQADTICGETDGAYFFHALWLFSYDESLGWTPNVGACG